MKLAIVFGSLLLSACFVQGADVSSAPPAPVTRADPHLELRANDQTPGLHFTLKQAEEYALANHPQIAAARFNADAVRQQIREARSQFFPQVAFESDSVYAPKGTQLTAQYGVNNSSVDSRQSDGVLVSQLITDFGRTYDLTESAHFRADAAADRTHVASAIVVLQVDRAYFDLLKAHAVLQVANETVHARQVTYNQISGLARHQLKSILDVTFADLNLNEANLLLVQAQSGIATAEAELSTALGFPEAQHFALTEESVADTPLPDSPENLIQEAMTHRPELASLHNEEEAAQRFAQAQDAARYPKITALGAAGVNPVGNRTEVANNYYTAGVNVEVPVLTGGNLDAHVEEARLLAQGAGKNLVDAQNTISRDVRVAWLNVLTEKRSLDLTAKLVSAAQQEVKLADARYRLGSSSIVELIQAQLDFTQAGLQDASARYGFQNGLSLLKFTTGSGF